MNLKKHLAALSLSLVAAATAVGCSSNSEIPDASNQEQKQYRSVNTDEQVGEEGSNAAVTPAANGVPHAYGPIATVNGKDIPAEDFNTEIERLVASGQFPPQLLAHVAPQIVERLIDQELMDGAVTKANITVTDAEVDSKLDEIRQEISETAEEMGGPARSLEDMVEELGISQEELRDSIRQSIAIERLLIDNGLQVPDAQQVRAFYDANQEMFQVPEQIRARHILIRVEPDASEADWEAARVRAEEIRKEAAQPGADFVEIARTRSEGPSAPQGGELGMFPRGQMVPEFENVAFALNKDEVSEPVRTQFGWHIIQVTEKQPAGVLEFDEVQPRLERELRNQTIQQALQGYLENLRAESQIEMHEENIR